MSLSSDFFSGLSSTEKESIFAHFPVTRSYWQLQQKNSGSDLGSQLRLQKAKDFLSAVAATWLKAHSTKDVCSFWSHQSEERLKLSLTEIHSQLQLQSPDWCVFAFGKMGSFELNLSSDIDLIWVSKDPPTEVHTKALRIFQNHLQTTTDFGFCHRLDFDLRPGGRMGPVVASFEQWSDYFSNFIDAWERLAFIRFRPIWGHRQLTDQLLEHSTKLTFKKYLDFGLLEAFKALRRQIHSQNWMRSQDEKIDLKLGVGGIRDLELFIHTLQVIYGGKEPSVRVRSTEKAIQELTQLGALSSPDSKFLIDHYWELRTLENLVQAVGDEQTHILTPSFSKALVSDETRLRLVKNMEICNHLVSTLFGAIDGKAKSLPDSEQDQKQWLFSIGVQGSELESTWKEILAQEVLSRQKQRDHQAKLDFVFQFLSRSHELGKNIELQLPRLRDFIKKSRAKASLFHLLLKNPTQLDRFVHLLGSSGYLSQILIHRPEILDSFLLERQASIETCPDWESKIQNWKERRFFSEIYQGLSFLDLPDLQKVQTALTTTADSVCTELLAEIKKEIPSSLQILALGKWGGQELGFGSDLDFIFLTEQEPTDTDFQVARRFLNRLTQGESIYSVDLRLKPFGSSGAMMSSKDGLRNFLQNEAPAWQRQCYLKARPMGDLVTAQEIYGWATSLKLNSQDLEELGRIQSELHRKKESPIKFHPGGLLDIELFVQTEILRRQQIPAGSNFKDHCACLGDPNLQNLEANYYRLRTLEQNLRLQSPNLFDDQAYMHSVNSGENPPETLKILTENLNYLKQLDPRPRQD